MKILLITDQHFGVRGDSQVFLEYQRRFYEDVVFPTIDEHDIKTVIDLGDTFDRRKFVNYYTLKAANQMWFTPLKERGIDLHILIGNHTTFYKDTNEVNSPDLLLSGHHVYSEATDIELDGIKFLMIPWINSANHSKTVRAIKRTKAQLVFAHLELQGFEVSTGIKLDHGMTLKHFEKFDMVMTGHFHHKSHRENVYYLGAPHENTWIDYEDPKGFHLFDTGTRVTEFIRNPYTMFNKLWYNDEGRELENILNFNAEKYVGTYVKVILTKCTNPYFLDLFLEKLQKADVQNIQIVEDHLNSHLDDDELVNEAEDTLTILSKYIDGLEIDVDKRRLDSLMKSLYHEAMTLELEA
tara:strand:- start:4838 stop:5896 length:1059 start_codon:yes stop_codon:yes gene_type:complete